MLPFRVMRLNKQGALVSRKGKSFQWFWKKKKKKNPKCHCCYSWIWKLPRLFEIGSLKFLYALVSVIILIGWLDQTPSYEQATLKLVDSASEKAKLAPTEKECQPFRTSWSCPDNKMFQLFNLKSSFLLELQQFTSLISLHHKLMKVKDQTINLCNNDNICLQKNLMVTHCSYSYSRKTKTASDPWYPVK